MKLGALPLPSFSFWILKLVSFSNFRLVVAQIVNNWTMMPDQDKISVFTKVCWTGSNMMRNQEIIQLPRSFNCKIPIFDTLFEVFGTVDQFLVGCPICMNLDLFVGYTTRNGLPGIVYFWLIRRPIFTGNCRIYLRYLAKIKPTTSVTIMCHNDELNWLFINRFRTTMKVRRIIFFK